MLSGALGAFTGRDLQAAAQVLAAIEAAGMWADGPTLRARLAAEIDRRSAARPAAGGEQAAPPRAAQDRHPVCPSCHRGVLAPVVNRDGLRIRGCRLCRYSEVVA